MRGCSVQWQEGESAFEHVGDANPASRPRRVELLWTGQERWRATRAESSEGLQIGRALQGFVGRQSIRMGISQGTHTAHIGDSAIAATAHVIG